MYRVIRWFLLVAVAWTVITALPGLARFLRMRRL
jgi:hypothetical protein